MNQKIKTTVFLFHPDIKSSKVNYALKSGTGGDIVVRDIYALYPDERINIREEQKHLNQSDRIVFQFPIYWYSSPALLKKWEDQVLEHGWAYESHGNALAGKELLIAATFGSTSYGVGKETKYTYDELLYPYHALADYVGMNYMNPFILSRTIGIRGAKLREKVKEYYDYLHS